MKKVGKLIPLADKRVGPNVWPPERPVAAPWREWSSLSSSGSSCASGRNPGKVSKSRAPVDSMESHPMRDYSSVVEEANLR